MAKWEFAAIVANTDGNKWALRTQGNSTNFEYTIEVVLSGKAPELFNSYKDELEKSKGIARVVKISPTVFHVIFSSVDTWDKHPADLELEIDGGNALIERWTGPRHTEAMEKRFGETINSGKVICDYQSQMTLFESDDIMVLINLAGAEGWEITGGIGLNDNTPGSPESRWRIMRREL